ncbi:MAG: hypothetical protein RLZZ262_1615 [Bacteroidota bacterium]|jgi:hypothetical protein
MRSVIVVLFLMVHFISNAQKEFSGGLVFGPVTSQISGDGLGGWDKFGLVGGGWVKIPINENSGIQMSMVYINKGSRTVDTLARTSFSYLLDYIEMPILLDWKSPFLNKKLHGLIGPSVGFNIRQKIKANGAISEPNPAFETFDIGFFGGVAYDFTAKYQLVLRTSTSIIPTRPSPSNPNPASFYLRGNYNQTLQLLFSMRL